MDEWRKAVRPFTYSWGDCIVLSSHGRRFENDLLGDVAEHDVLYAYHFTFERGFIFCFKGFEVRCSKRLPSHSSMGYGRIYCCYVDSKFVTPGNFCESVLHRIGC